MTPVERLESAGLCKSSGLSDKEKDQINKMSDEEVTTLISLHNKFDGSDEVSDGARPNFPL